MSKSLKEITSPYCEAIVVDNPSKGDDAQALTERLGKYVHPKGKAAIWSGK